MVQIARDTAGYVLPLDDQPWSDGPRTPEEFVQAWEQANREDWVHFDAWLREDNRRQKTRPGGGFVVFLMLAFCLLILLLFR